MDAKRLQQVYLRAMYTSVPAACSSKEEAFLVTHASTERLIVERAARIRNLRTVLHDDMCLLKKVLDKAALLPYVKAYADSDCFWMHRGRTLIEDFCLFFVEHASASPVHKLLGRIEGVCSGLSVTTSATSPWSGHDERNAEGDVAEAFIAPFSLPFRRIFEEQSSYEPSQRPVTCVVRRSGQQINVKFLKD